LRETVNVGLPGRHVETDKFVHAFSVRVVRHWCYE
jgi:hypothetical protein